MAASEQDRRAFARRTAHVRAFLFRPPFTPSTTTMAAKFADHTLYHLSPKGFWKKFRACARRARPVPAHRHAPRRRCRVREPLDLVRPAHPGRAPLPAARVAPGEVRHAGDQGCVARRIARSVASDVRTPAASDPAQNPYWKRDVRRAYPQLSVVTQSELSTLLIEHHEAQQAYVPRPPRPTCLSTLTPRAQCRRARARGRRGSQGRRSEAARSRRPHRRDCDPHAGRPGVLGDEAPAVVPDVLQALDAPARRGRAARPALVLPHVAREIDGRSAIIGYLLILSFVIVIQRGEQTGSRVLQQLRRPTSLRE